MRKHHIFGYGALDMRLLGEDKNKFEQKEDLPVANGEPSTYEPNFVSHGLDEQAQRATIEASETEWWRTHRDKITEENWPEWQAKGFVVVDELPTEGKRFANVNIARSNYGDNNVYTGEAFDETEGRPLHLKPGPSIYTTREAKEHYDHESAELFREAADHFRNHYSDHVGVITEENWPAYQAQGFRVVGNAPLTGDTANDNAALYNAMITAGADNVYTGEAFDEVEGRPLQHKPGQSIYVSDKGVEVTKAYMKLHGFKDENPDPAPVGAV